MPRWRVGVVWIGLDYTADVRCDGRGNCERERAAFGYASGGTSREGAVVDVYLRERGVPLAHR